MLVNKLDWKPLISFACILALLFFIIALFNISAAQFSVGFIVSVMLALAGLSQDHYLFLKNFWFSNVPSETHQSIICVFIFVTVYVILLILTAIIFYCIKNYKILSQFSNKKII